MELTTHMVDEERRVRREALMAAIQLAVQRCARSGLVVMTDDEEAKNPTTRFFERLTAEHANFVEDEHKFDLDLSALFSGTVTGILFRVLGISKVSSLIGMPYMRLRLVFYGSEMRFPAYVGYLHPNPIE